MHKGIFAVQCPRTKQVLIDFLLPAMSESDVSGLFQSLSQNYDLESVEADMDMARLKEMLILAMKRLLRSDPERLLSIMYRLDVNELLFRKAMEQPTEDAKAESLGELVFKRELQRLEFRKKYKPPSAE